METRVYQTICYGDIGMMTIWYGDIGMMVSQQSYAMTTKACHVNYMLCRQRDGMEKLPNV